MPSTHTDIFASEALIKTRALSTRALVIADNSMLATTSDACSFASQDADHCDRRKTCARSTAGYGREWWAYYEGEAPRLISGDRNVLRYRNWIRGVLVIKDWDIFGTIEKTPKTAEKGP